MTIEETQADPVARPRGILRRIRRPVFLYCVVPYLTMTVGFTVFQRSLMYRPTVADNLRIADCQPLDGEDVQRTTPTNHKIHGWLIRNSRVNPIDEQSQLVVYFPGNSLNRRNRIDDLREFTSRGYDVLIFDYRGFGDSTGSPSETALTNDARLVWQYAIDELGYEETETVIFGESLGGAVALSLWNEDNPHPPQPAALILNSTFASMPRTVAWHFPWFPFQYLLLDRWPSIDRIGRVQSPIIIFHGDNDQMIPLSHGKALADASTNAQFIEIRGGSHNDIPMLQLRKQLDALKSIAQ